MLQRLAEGSQPTPSAGSSEPLKLIATDDAAALSWTPGRNEAGYHVYRATDPSGPFVQLTAEPVRGASYADTGLSPRTR